MIPALADTYKFGIPFTVKLGNPIIGMYINQGPLPAVLYASGFNVSFTIVMILFLEVNNLNLNCKPPGHLLSLCFHVALILLSFCCNLLSF